MGDRDWLTLAARLVAIQIFGCALVAFALGFTRHPPLLGYSISGGAFIIGTVCVIALGDTWRCFRSGGNSPTRYIVDCFRARRHKLNLALIGLALAILQMTILTWIKATLPLVQDYWADPYLAAADRLILGGVDAYRLAQMVPIGPVIDRLYTIWFPWLAIVFTINLFREPSATKAQAGLSFFLTFALVGVCGMFVMPSGGPIFYERLGYGPHFADLTNNLPQFAWFASEYLWAKQHGLEAAPASGISAMPSMHVAMAMWTFLTLKSVNRRAGYAAAAYAVAVVFGSVYLGWHYLTDGIVGALGAVSCWHLASVPKRESVAVVSRLRKS